MINDSEMKQLNGNDHSQIIGDNQGSLKKKGIKEGSQNDDKLSELAGEDASQ